MKDKEKLDIALEALRTYRGLNITYRDWLGHVSSRAILPFRVYEREGVVHIQSYCWLAKDVRHFSLPGILRIELRAKVVERAVYIKIRDENEELGRFLSQACSLIKSVNLEKED
jgi:predicted DNA-binding transcriptional regulator YafY